MPNYNSPILVWKDTQGLFTACPVEPETELAGTGRTAPAAIEQLRKYLEWSFRNDPWQVAPDFRSAELVTVPVEVRPVYNEDDRVYPCGEVFPLRIAVVTGQRESGLRVCSAPMFGLQFDHDERDSYSDLIQEHIRAKLACRTPRQLSRFLLPDDVQLKNLTVRVPTEAFHKDSEIRVPALEEVADALDGRQSKQRFSRAWLRDGEVSDLVERFLKESASIVLVGERGVGKTTLLVDASREAARRQRDLSAEATEDDESVPRGRPRPSRFWLTSAAKLIAGMQYLGEWQARVEDVIENLSRVQGVLCVESLLDLLRSGGREASDSIAAFLMPFIEHGDIRLVGEATAEEFDACGRLLPGFADLLQKVPVEPLDADQAVQALHLVVEPPGRKMPFEVDEDVVDTTCRLHRRFLPYQTLPGAAAGFLRDVDEVAVRDGVTQITAPLIRRHFRRQTGLPELFLRDDLGLQLETVVDQLQQQVIGQAQAVRSAAHVIATFKAGLNDPLRPISVLLFCGPTGVGKTELAKAVSGFCFGSGGDGRTGSPSASDSLAGRVTDDRLLRLDMSEFGGPGSADRLVTKPDGRPTRFIEKLRQQPFQVILLDEIEKASPDVFDVLLNVFDEGRLTDRWGRTVSFQSAIIIMTSNIGADRSQSVGFGESGSPDYEREATRFFRPEFFNRIDELVSFQSLDDDTVRRIIRKELDSLSDREHLRESRITLRYTPELVEFIARHGFDKRYGARPLQRFIESFITGPLARRLVETSAVRVSNIALDLDDRQSLTISFE